MNEVCLPVYCYFLHRINSKLDKMYLIQYSLICQADFQSVEFSERAEILLFAGENVALKNELIVMAEQLSII